MSKQGFEEWFNDSWNARQISGAASCKYDSGLAWNHQQQTIDLQAEKIKELEQLLNKRIVFQRLKVAEEEIKNRDHIILNLKNKIARLKEEK